MAFAFDPQQIVHSIRLLPVRYIAIVLSLLFISLIALSSDAAPSLASVTNRWSMPAEPHVHAGGAAKKAKGKQPSTVADPFAETPVRANATFVILARNSDVWEIVASIRGMEDRFNKDYNYPYTFLNDEPFSDEFKKYTSGVASGPCTYGLVEAEDWNDPSWIDQDKAKTAREGMEKAGVIYGGSVPYRRMCRWQSGYFFRHPLMLKYKYYWPSVKYFCDVRYDPFMLMQEQKKKYGFVLSIYEYAETIPTLWDTTKEFMKDNPQYLAKPNTMAWISGDKGDTYNRCHFWSNFEIGDLDFFRGEAYMKYFEHLDKAGGFFYERWGDAPVHSIAASLFLNPDELHFFQDMGYRHEPFQHCPKGKPDSCACNPNDENNFEEHWYSCTPEWKKITKWKPGTVHGGMLHALGG